LKARNKVKPDLQRKSLLLSPAADWDGGRSTAKQTSPSNIQEDNIPWAEIIFESASVQRGQSSTVALGEIIDSGPPLALFGLSALGLLILLYFSS
jgi:hypothetical protein